MEVTDSSVTITEARAPADRQWLVTEADSEGTGTEAIMEP